MKTKFRKKYKKSINQIEIMLESTITIFPVFYGFGKSYIENDGKDYYPNKGMKFLFLRFIIHYKITENE